MNTQTIELDLSKDGLGGNVVRVGQGDKGGTTIRACIYDNGAEVALAGYTAYLEALLPNKRNYYRAAASVSGNVATVTVDEGKLASVAGYTDEAYFTLEKSGAKYSTERFAIEILRNARDGQQPAQNWDDAVDNLIMQGSEAVAAANSAASGANRAASAANGAANSANSAASAANTAAETAADEAAAAKSSASAAATAAGAANTAAGTANTAAETANDAASAANRAASAANAEATTASKAAAAATSAKDAADRSAIGANEAANSANTAAADAKAAAEEARGSVSQDQKIYLTYDEAGGTNYLTLVDMEG